MLKISLKKNEPVYIQADGKTVKLMVVGFNGKYQMLFDAPKEVSIKREKVLNQGKENPGGNDGAQNGV